MPNATCGFQGHPGGDPHFQKGKRTGRAWRAYVLGRGLVWNWSRKEPQHFSFISLGGTQLEHGSQPSENEVKVIVAQLCQILCNPMDCSPPGSSVHRTSQARRLEWIAIACSRGSSQPRDRTQVSGTSYITSGFFTI